MAGWVVFGTSVITAVSALAGALGSQLLRSRSETEQARERSRFGYRDSRRQAYEELLGLASRLDLSTVNAEREDLAEVLGTLCRAAASAELHASADTWDEMSGYISAVTLKVQAFELSAGGSEQALATGDGVGSVAGVTPDKVSKLRERFVRAARADLRHSQLRRPPQPGPGTTPLRSEEP